MRGYSRESEEVVLTEISLVTYIGVRTDMRL